ncbi:hypothetical protein ADIMK_0032 [Marinobacterium lacunae]|uniref:Uncharacterized protein n=1 Tax=Marinobacterium lacunae TaxID=1232683 RepID=A0A081G4L5_9GAMM|nr:hypothetical protein ADIMK_0032 [Marinobacterium lacunae]
MIGGDLDSCLEPFTGTALYAGGLEPAWSLLLSDERLVFNQPGRLRTLVFDQPKRMRVGTLWRWYQRLDDGKGQLDVAFEVERKPCRDEQGVWYALTAHVNLDEVLFDGCARYGDLQRLTLASRYRTPAGQYLRDIHVLMKADGSARLIEENHNGLPLVPRAGAWRFLNSDRILLELARDGSEGAVDTLLWKLGNDGSLTLLNDDPALGRGLELQPLGAPLQWPEGGRKPLP